ncbi:ADP-ribose pyrophosphatase [Sphingomonas gellani]|uniref:GDP-mannose pyrophosphatase n=1 Tax=Sphingomonas gellani TaxID=1166340 RepID=A0A1H8BEC9_9SPHN|nr:NUDIX hydrolase [Sphingomonas gellani]SEM81162.1 ADP-ribose pyrophosphatase [Sphingomonas gellani]
MTDTAAAPAPAPETVWEGKYLTAIKAGHWEYAERKGRIGAAVIVAVNDAGELILVEQARIPVGRRCLELPAGLVGDESADETLEQAAIRELEEETGYRAERIEVLGEYYSSPGMTSEAFTMVRATGLTRTGDGGGEEGEDIVVHRVPVADVERFVAEKRAAGLGIDAKLLALLGPKL